MSSLLSRFLQDAGEALGFNMKDDGGEDLVEDYSEEDKGGSSSSGGGISIAVSQGVQGSCTWIRIGAAGKGGKAKGSHKIVVNPRPGQQILQPLGYQQPLNLLSVVGAARQGKSFLMNMLAGEEGLFRISNSQDPCTQGVELSRKVMAWKDFAGIDGGQVPKVSGSKQPRVSFVDCEGQGDRDVTYDANLVSPILLSSKCVIFNWKDSLQKDKLLNHLCVMQRAAYNVSSDEGDDDAGGGGQGQQRIFGHLHIVFRDWMNEGTAESVKKELFTIEKTIGPDASSRNELRRVLQASFETISVWLLPMPTVRTEELKKPLSFEDLSPDFRDKIRKLRAALSQQLASPHHFSGKPLTGPLIASLVPTIVNTLNSGRNIMPKSAYRSLLEAEANRKLFKMLSKINQDLKEAKAEAEKEVLTMAKLEQRLKAIQSKSKDEFTKWLRTLGDPELLDDFSKQFAEQSAKAVSELLSYNRSQCLEAHLSRAKKRAKEIFEERFTLVMPDRLPLNSDRLVQEGNIAKEAADNHIYRLLGSEPELLKEVEEAREELKAYANRKISDMQKLNDEKVVASLEQEIESYQTAYKTFTQTFDGALERLASKAPVTLVQFDKAYFDSFTDARQQLVNALKNGMTTAKRQQELIGRLEEAALQYKTTQGAVYQTHRNEVILRETMSSFRQLMDRGRAELVPIEDVGVLHQQYEQLSGEVLRGLQGKMGPDQAPPLPETRVQLVEYFRSFAREYREALEDRNERLRLEEENTTLKNDLHALQHELDSYKRSAAAASAAAPEASRKGAPSQGRKTGVKRERSSGGGEVSAPMDTDEDEQDGGGGAASGESDRKRVKTSKNSLSPNARLAVEEARAAAAQEQQMRLHLRADEVLKKKQRGKK